MLKLSFVFVLFFGALAAKANSFNYNQYLEKCGGKHFAKCDADGLDQETIFDAALEEAKSSKRYVIVDLGADWCGWCVILDKSIDGSPEVKLKIEKRALIAHISADAQSHKKVLGRFGGSEVGYPHFYIIDPSTQKMIGNFSPGRYLEPEKLYQKIDEVLTYPENFTPLVA